ncbi:MAG TPA: M48 family metalloprotease [Thermoplasmata archaeon]|nr:M48 family metalloprotease [Thermoplasmata archaeon]
MGAFDAAPLLVVPVALWAASGVAVAVAARRSRPVVVLRIAVAFAALWALLVTTVLVSVVLTGGWAAVVRLAGSPLWLLQPAHWRFWVWGGIGALAVLALAFSVNQLVGRGLLQLLDRRTLEWPARLPVPSERTTLSSFRSPRLEAFSFTLLEPPSEGRGLHRHEFILLSEGLLTALEPAEVEAVIAHELGHIRDLDARYLTFVRTFARLMRWDPLLALLSQRLTRHEEFWADYEAARMTRQPLALARALFKVQLDPDGAGRGGPVALGLLGGSGRRARADVVLRIERLLELADSPEFREPASA